MSTNCKNNIGLESLTLAGSEVINVRMPQVRTCILA